MTEQDDATTRQADMIADLDELEDLIESLKDRHAAMLVELAQHIAKHGYRKVQE